MWQQPLLNVHIVIFSPFRVVSTESFLHHFVSTTKKRIQTVTLHMRTTFKLEYWFKIANDWIKGKWPIILKVRNSWLVLVCLFRAITTSNSTFQNVLCIWAKFINAQTMFACKLFQFFQMQTTNCIFLLAQTWAVERKTLAVFISKVVVTATLNISLPWFMTMLYTGL